MGKGAEPPAHLFLLVARPFFLFVVLPPCRSIHGAGEEVFRHGEGENPSGVVEPELLPPKKRRGCPRETTVAPTAVQPWHECALQGFPVSADIRGQGPARESGRGSSGGRSREGEQALAARPPCP